MKKLFGFFLFIAFLGSLAWAGPWAIVVNSQSMNINTIDLGQTPPKVYGPFFTGSLGAAGNGLFDVAVTPDSKYALLSNFGESKVFRIDISNPTNPVLAGSISIGFFAEDIAISPNGRFAVVADGGFSQRLAFIDLANFPSFSVYTMTSGLTANGVAIGNDNSTIILPDYFNSRIVFGRANATFSGLISESSLFCDSRPVNITISPDGATALTANVSNARIGVYQITGPGVVVPGSTPSVEGFHDIPQSIAFAPDGKKAYIINSGQGSDPNRLSWIKINGPGNAAWGAERVANLSGYGSAQWFGVDTIAVDSTGNYAIATKTTASSDPANRVTLINPNNYQATAIAGTEIDSAGVAIFNEIVYPPTNADLTRLTNNYIFYKEYINRLSWQANSKNLSPISKYRIYRKVAGAADSTYAQVIEVTASTLQYEDRGLKKNDSYTYKITSVNERGLESAGAEISNVIVMRRVR
jgi:DNA-binding beta-propeller fold protein YncE